MSCRRRSTPTPGWATSLRCTAVSRPSSTTVACLRAAAWAWRSTQTFEGAGFTWTPYGSLNAVREFDGEYNYSINGGLLGTTSTEGTSAMVELGLGARKGNLSVTGGVNWIDGGALESVSGGQLVDALQLVRAVTVRRMLISAGRSVCVRPVVA